ncbi:Uncharacterised protein [Vibrio cholerae]|nr:Uncharacterised protein [Vibrio cholerae]
MERKFPNVRSIMTWTDKENTKHWCELIIATFTDTPIGCVKIARLPKT